MLRPPISGSRDNGGQPYFPMPFFACKTEIDEVGDRNWSPDHFKTKERLGKNTPDRQKESNSLLESRRQRYFFSLWICLLHIQPDTSTSTSPLCVDTSTCDHGRPKKDGANIRTKRGIEKKMHECPLGVSPAATHKPGHKAERRKKIGFLRTFSGQNDACMLVRILGFANVQKTISWFVPWIVRRGKAIEPVSSSLVYMYSHSYNHI